MALVVFTGGARSGKSGAAQRLAARRALDGADVVVAVFGRDDAADPEFARRIERHRQDRPAGFVTVEAADASSWMASVPPDSLLLVDCLGTLLGLVMEEAWTAAGAGELYDDSASDMLPAGLESDVQSRFSACVEWLVARHGDTIVVTNEVGDGVVPGYPSGRLFRDLLGRANRHLTDVADAAYLCVAGRLIDLAGLPRDAAWPAD